MNNLRLLGFECRKQFCTMTFLIILAIFAAFAVSQLSEIFFMPVKSEQDIQALEKIGARDYIYVENSEEEIISSSIIYLKERIEDGSIPQDIVAEFDDVFQMLQSEKYSFNDVLSMTKNNEIVSPWLMACKGQFGQILGSVKEANQTMLSSLGNTGYSPKLYEKYVTYIQVIAAMIIFPLFLFLFTRDYRYGMYEIVYAQPFHSNKYIIVRYLGAFIPLMLSLYTLGALLNLISAVRFSVMGYSYQYTMFFPYFMGYIFPTIFFFSSVLMLLLLLFKKITAVFPIYIMFVILNVTPGIFGSRGDWIRAVSPILRLDGVAATMQATVINRMVYLILSIASLAVSCLIYKRLTADLRKGITI